MRGKGNGSSLQEKTFHTYTLRDHARVDFLSCIKKRKKVTMSLKWSFKLQHKTYLLLVLHNPIVQRNGNIDYW